MVGWCRGGQDSQSRSGAAGRGVFSLPDGWRLLRRVAVARWGAVGLAVLYALVGPHPPVPVAPLLLLAAMAAAYNLALAWHPHLPRIDAHAMALVAVAVDFVWITGSAALLTPSQDDLTSVIGYVVLGSECGLLLGWPGAAAGVGLSVAALLGVDVNAMLGHGGVADIGRVVYQAGTVAVAATFTAMGSTELREQQRELDAKTVALHATARRDHLTGLGNQRALGEAIARLRGCAYGLLLVDVDRMRWANVVYGHEAGDEMLLGVARVLCGIRETDDVAIRLGEDKFVLLLPGASQQRVTDTAETLRRAVHRVAVSTAQLRVSVGCAWTAGDDDSAAVMARADEALYAAKMRGGDCVEVQSTVQRGSRWRLRDAVHTALQSERGVYTVYQPIVDLRRGDRAGWEALSRPHSWPAGSSVEALFVTAHRMGRGRDLDWRCRRSALWDASRLEGPLFVNINVSGLVDPVHGVDQMLLLCRWAGRDPAQVVLELSERDAMPDLERLREVLADYRDAGFRFALDDLGEGQTTLEVVLAARPEFLKLARPLVQAARRGDTARSAVRALVTFAHDIGSAVIAEGVEDEADRELCAGLDVDLGQGWLFGRPQPPDRLLPPPSPRR